MLPILSQGVEGKKVSIYNPAVQPKHPLNGFRLKNTTPLYLMQGPITVFDDGAYAGDARIEDLAPGQDRLISYALDLKVEVEPQDQGGRQDLVAVKLRRGTLIATRKSSDAKLYLIRNRDRKAKDVLIEHPFRDGWDLVEPSEPAERTREVYRFAAKVEPDKTARLLVREERQSDEAIALTNLGPDQIAVFLKSRGHQRPGQGGAPEGRAAPRPAEPDADRAGPAGATHRRDHPGTGPHPREHGSSSPKTPSFTIATSRSSTSRRRSWTTFARRSKNSRTSRPVSNSS